MEQKYIEDQEKFESKRPQQREIIATTSRLRDTLGRLFILIPLLLHGKSFSAQEAKPSTVTGISRGYNVTPSHENAKKKLHELSLRLDGVEQKEQWPEGLRQLAATFVEDVSKHLDTIESETGSKRSSEARELYATIIDFHKRTATGRPTMKSITNWLTQNYLARDVIAAAEPHWDVVDGIDVKRIPWLYEMNTYFTSGSEIRSDAEPTMPKQRTLQQSENYSDGLTVLKSALEKYQDKVVAAGLADYCSEHQFLTQVGFAAQAELGHLSKLAENVLILHANNKIRVVDDDTQSSQAESLLESGTYEHLPDDVRKHLFGETKQMARMIGRIVRLSDPAQKERNMHHDTAMLRNKQRFTERAFPGVLFKF